MTVLQIPPQTLMAVTMSVAEFTQATGLKRRTVYHYLREGLIPSIRINRTYRIRRDVVEQILKDGLFRRIA